jgi:intracellular septation protein
MIFKLILSLGIEFGPIVAFLVASEFASFISAATIFVVLTFIALVVGYIERKEMAWFPLIVGLSVIISGTLTVVLKDPIYLILKDTIYNGAFALILFVGLYYKKSLLQPLFKGLFSMTDIGWRILTMRWAIVFTILTVTNEIARIYLSPEDWVNYKSLATVSTIIFSLYQFKLSKRERLPESSPWGMRINN